MQTRILQCISQLLSHLNTEHPVEEIFKQIGMAIRPLIPFDRFSLSMSQMRYWYYLQNGKVTTLRDFSLFNDTTSASTWVFHNKMPLRREDILKDPRFEFDLSIGNQGMRSDLIVPLIVDTLPIGTFNFSSFPAGAYTEDHTQRALAITDAIAVGVKQLQTRQEHDVIERVMRGLQQADDVDSVLYLILKHLQMQYDRVRIYLYDPEAQILRGRIQLGAEITPDFHNRTYAVDRDPYSRRTLSGNTPKIYRTGTPEYRAWLSHIHEKSIQPDPDGGSEWAEIPIKVKQSGREIIVGKISLDNALTHIPLHQEHLNRSMLFVSQAALAIHQAQLHTNMAEQVAQRTAALAAAKARIEAMAEFQKQMLNTPVVWIYACNDKQRITFWNRGAELLSGYKADEVIDNPEAWQLFFPDGEHLKYLGRISKDIFDRNAHLENFETPIRCKDATSKTISWYANPLRDPQGKIPGFLAIGIDITEHKKLEEEVVRLERLKALGELSAGVSHNLNNMLTGILGPADLLKHLTRDPALVENIDDIITSAIRASDLVRQLNRAVRRDIHDKLKTVDANKVIREAVRGATPRWKDEAEARGVHIDIQMRLGDVPYVAATEAGLYDVLLNLIFNAVDAMPGGGTITFETVQSGENVRLTVADTGIGMTEATRLRIFDPFFTTKMDVGTGLGLATVYATIQRWNARISVESTEGEGATFLLDLPMASQIREPFAEPSSPSPLSAKILIVEDDAVIQRLLKRGLSRHTVTTAANGAQALEQLSVEKFDLAFIDLGLPDMSGDELAQKLKKQNPNLQTALMTGWMLTEDDPRRQAFDHYVQKPILNLTSIERIIFAVMAKKFPG